MLSLNRHTFLLGTFLFCFCALGLIVDSYLLHRTAEFFGGTALNRPFTLKTTTQYASFVILALFYSLVFFGTILAILYRLIFPWLGLNAAQSLYSSIIVFGGTYASYTTIKHQIHKYFQNMFDIQVLKELTAGNFLNLFGYISPQHLLIALGGLGFVCLNILVIKWLGKTGEPLKNSQRSKFTFPSLCLAWLIILVAHFSTASYESLRFGLRNTLAYLLPDETLRVLSDFDRDGFGPLTSPPDSNNMDADINPWALDIPGNNKDENGLIGDFSESSRTHEPDLKLPKNSRSQPVNVILVVVETFRSDVVKMKLDGSEVMPFLSSLAENEAFTPDAHSNYGVTARAIQTLFFGKLGYKENDPTLFDLFKKQGYGVHTVSAMDENWGNNYGLLGMDKLDSFFDTRFIKWQERELTTWEKMNTSLLSLDWQELNKKAFEVIGNSEQPFFLYLNYQDLHYPYHQSSMELKFIDQGEKDSRFFKPENRDKILRQYANAAFHLDKGFRQLFEFLQEKGLSENTVVMIIGDHPDSIYENGLLGHAWTVDQHQRRTPLFLSGAGGEIKTPVGQHELGQILLNSVFSEKRPSPTAMIPDQSKKQFVLTGSLEQPRQIGWLSKNDLIAYDFKTGRAQFGENGSWLKLDKALKEPKGEHLKTLINYWESLRAARAGL